MGGREGLAVVLLRYIVILRGGGGGGGGGSPVLLLLVTQGGVGGLFFDVTCDIGGGRGGSPMLPLLVTWVPGTNVTRYNRYPTSSRLLRVTVLQYKIKILACYKAQIAHFGGEFSKKCN